MGGSRLDAMHAKRPIDRLLLVLSGLALLLTSLPVGGAVGGTCAPARGSEAAACCASVAPQPTCCCTAPGATPDRDGSESRAIGCDCAGHRAPLPPISTLPLPSAPDGPGALSPLWIDAGPRTGIGGGIAPIRAARAAPIRSGPPPRIAFACWRL